MKYDFVLVLLTLFDRISSWGDQNNGNNNNNNNNNNNDNGNNNNPNNGWNNDWSSNPDFNTDSNNWNGVLRPKSLVICLDGVRSDALANARTPAMDSLRDGSWSMYYNGAFTLDAQNIYDANSLTGPNHVAIATGVTAAKSGVSTNNGMSQGAYNTYPHYMKRIKDALPYTKSAVFTGWKGDLNIPTGADYIVLGPNAGLVSDGVELLTGNHHDVTYDSRCEIKSDGGCWEHVCFSNSGNSQCTGDCDYSKDNCKMGDWSYADADLTYFFMDNPEDPGHKYGFNDDGAYMNRIEMIDSQIGYFLEAIESRDFFDRENWQIIITSDHGGYNMNYQQSSGVTKTGLAHTIPFLMTSRNVTQGRLPVNTHNYDVAPTVLHHFGVTVPYGLNGWVRGFRDVEQKAPVDLKEDLMGYYRFEQNYQDSSGRGNNATARGDVLPVLYSSGGRRDSGFVRIGNGDGGYQGSSYISLGTSTDLNPYIPDDYNFNGCPNSGSTTCSINEFSVALWYRPHTHENSPKMLIGNKNWYKEASAISSNSNGGWMLLSDAEFSVKDSQSKDLGNQRGFNLNAGDTKSSQGAFSLLTEPTNTNYYSSESYDGWLMVAATVSKEGLMQVYSGGTDGRLHWSNTEFGTTDTINSIWGGSSIKILDLVSTYPINIGNDGAASYSTNVDADIDDVMIWRRALAREEVEALYNRGQPIALYLNACQQSGVWPSTPAGGMAIIDGNCQRNNKMFRECQIQDLGGGQERAVWGQASDCQWSYSGGQFAWSIYWTAGVAVAGGVIMLLCLFCTWKWYAKRQRGYTTIHETPVDQVSPLPKKPPSSTPHTRNITKSTVFSDLTIK